MSGAGGVKSANYMYNVASKDGSVLAMLNPGASMVPLLRKGQKAIRFKTRDLNWLGTASVRTYTIAFWHKSPIKTVEDLKKKTGHNGDIWSFLYELLNSAFHKRSSGNQNENYFGL
tara:strand:- start:377 stop:724 length:348 start_codon:yes stop_codon:yes gene_type:complete